MRLLLLLRRCRGVDRRNKLGERRARRMGRSRRGALRARRGKDL